MGEAKFTPGPWKRATDAQGTCGILHPTKNGVAVAWLSAVHYPANGYVGDESRSVGIPEREANAHLIAAAPELYEALQACLNFMENTESELGFSLESADQARAALAKARGEVS